MKVLMTTATGVADPGHTIAIQRRASMQLLQQATAARGSTTSVADQLHLDRLIVVTNAELRWLDIAEQTLEGISSLPAGGGAPAGAATGADPGKAVDPEPRQRIDEMGGNRP